MNPRSRFVACLLLAAPLAAGEPLSEPQATVARICADKKNEIHCVMAQLQVQDTQDLLERSLSSPNPAKDLAALDLMNRTCTNLSGLAVDLERGLERSGLKTRVFLAQISVVREKLRKLSLATLQSRLADISKEVSDLEQSATAAVASSAPKSSRTAMVQQLGVQGGQVFERFKAISISIDVMGYPTEAPVMGLRDSANRVALRLAAERDRLLLLQRSLDLPLSSWQFNGIVQSFLAPAAATQAKVDPKAVRLPGAGSFPAAAGPDDATDSGPEGVGAPMPPAAVPSIVKPKSLLDVPRFKPSLPAAASPAWKPDFDLTSQVLHWSGLSRTVGDPAGRASLVHHQAAGDTCAIVSQQQFLTAYGLTPEGDAREVEKQLTHEARTQGFFSEGTPPAYGGDLLVSHGMIITKRADATDAQLEAAARRGRMIIVGMDPGILWNDARYVGGGHAIVVTGMEYAVLTGKVLGYYINDSGTDPPGQGRFVPADRFLDAWHKRGAHTIEAQ